MKKVLILATVLVVGLPVLALGQTEGYYDRSYVRLSYVKGDVYVQRAQDLGYEQGELNLVLVQGDKIGTRDGRVEVQLGRGNYLRLDAETLVELVALPRGDSEPAKFHLLSGKIFVRVASLDREKNFEIHTPDASFYVLDEGLYRVDIIGNMETEFMVYRGQAESAAEDGSILVQEGEMIVAANGRFTTSAMALRARNDDFGAWNSTRDNLYARRMSRTYLPAEYADYESELNDYGRWTYEDSYGYVWVPTVSYMDWRPYYNGRWVWYPIIGWTWVSYEPWGWCTYHYGRWGWRHSLGWYWIPHRHWNWGPAWVHWWHGYDYYGWCPLSYYNYPAVIVNNYFYDRYDRGYFPNNSRTLIVVNKNQLQNRRISQVALGGDALSRVGRISLGSAQPELRPSLNRGNDVALRAQRVLDKDGLRSVGRNFGTEGRRVSSGSLAAPTIRRAGEGQSASGTSTRDRVVNARESGQAGASSELRRVERSSAANPREGASPRSVNERVIRPRGEDRPVSAAPRIRDTQGSEAAAGRRVENEGPGATPSRRVTKDEPGRSSAVSRDGSPSREVSPSRVTRPDQPERKVIKESTQPTSPRKQEGEGRSPSSLPSARQNGERVVEERRVSPQASPSRGSELRSNSSPSRNTTPSRVIRERDSNPGTPTAPRSVINRSTEPRNSAAPRSVSPAPSGRSASNRILAAPSRTVRPSTPSYSAPSRSSSVPSRSSSAPARSYSTPSRSSSAPSRSYSAPSRSSSAPSRSYSAPSRSSSSPSRSVSSPSPSSGSSSRSSSAPSRSYSSPSRSNSAPSRSYSAPSRSSSSPSRSVSSPSRSSGSSSRSSGSPSRSSSGSGSSRSSGGSVRKK